MYLCVNIIKNNFFPRLMSKNDDTKGNTMYTISLRRNRVISIRKSFIEVLKGPEEGTENIQKEEVSTSYKWINSETYTGIWFMIKYGYIAIGNDQKFIMYSETCAGFT